jgi:hypothetical protein
VPPRVAPSRSKESTIGLLTAGLVTVSPSTRYVLVEDEDDIKFYAAIRDILVDYGPSRDPRAIQPAPTIVFLPASTGAGKAKVGGGRTVVQAWVEKFDQPPLNELFRGIVDRDSGNASTSRVHVIGRHSIENYLCDPLVLFGLLLDAGTAPNVPGVTISTGDEHRLRTADAPALQLIVETIQGIAEPGIGAVDTSPRPVTFTNGRTITYPAWMIDYRGHDLLQVYQRAFGGPAVINPPRLEKNLRRVRLVPTELADIFSRLQSEVGASPNTPALP